MHEIPRRSRDQDKNQWHEQNCPFHAAGSGTFCISGGRRMDDLQLRIKGIDINAWWDARPWR
jgi:hypothetical protein